MLGLQKWHVNFVFILLLLLVLARVPVTDRLDDLLKKNIWHAPKSEFTSPWSPRERSASQLLSLWRSSNGSEDIPFHCSCWLASCYAHPESVSKAIPTKLVLQFTAPADYVERSEERTKMEGGERKEERGERREERGGGIGQPTSWTSIFIFFSFNNGNASSWNFSSRFCW